MYIHFIDRKLCEYSQISILIRFRSDIATTSLFLSNIIILVCKTVMVMKDSLLTDKQVKVNNFRWKLIYLSLSKWIVFDD